MNLGYPKALTGECKICGCGCSSSTDFCDLCALDDVAVNRFYAEQDIDEPDPDDVPEMEVDFDAYGTPFATGGYL